MSYRMGSRKVVAPLCGLGLALLAWPLQAQYLGTAAQQPIPGQIAPQPAPAAVEPLRIVVGDILFVQVLSAPELSTTAMTQSGDLRATGSAGIPGVQVDSRGEIEIPFAGAVSVAGMTVDEAGGMIDRLLKDKGILVDPEVMVRIVGSPTRVITVLGEVRTPMVVPGAEPVHLLDVLASCGGLTPLASHTITIRRSGQEEPITVELGSDPRAAELQNLLLRAGDTVLVPTAGTAFVLGEVKTSMPVPLSGVTPITVLRAVSIAGGLKYSAALSRARVIRPIADNRQVEIMFDLKKVMEGKQQDIALRANDLLLIPANAFKATIAAGGAQAAFQAVYAAAMLSNQLK